MSGVLCHCIGCRTPMIVSDLPEFREFLGDAAIYFKPGDAKDLYEQLKLVMNNTDLQTQLSEQLNILAKKYSWKEVGSTTLELYHNIFITPNKEVISDES